MRYSPPSRRPMQPYIDLQQQPVRPRPRAPLPLDGAAEGVSDGGTRQEHQRRGMLPLYAARIEDLGVGDFVKVDYAACHHVELLAPEFLLRLGCSAQTKVLDLNERVRCRGCGKRGRAAVFDQVAAAKRVSGLLPAPVKPSRRRRSFRPRQSGSTPPYRTTPRRGSALALGRVPSARLNVASRTLRAAPFDCQRRRVLAPHPPLP
jgi:hypothetical protein